MTSRPPRSKSLILDIYGAFVRELGGWLAVADLIRLMGVLGIDEQAVRSTMSRMTRRGLLVRCARGTRVGYEVSEAGMAILQEGDLRISNGLKPAHLTDGWALAIFSVPEDRRDLRHQLRSRLTFLGFGTLGGGAWLAPGRVMRHARDAVADLGLTKHVDLFDAHYRAFDDPPGLARRCWDLDALEERYSALIANIEPVLRQWRYQRRTGDVHAFVDYTLLLHQWRKMPYLDPGLPSELLPSNWVGARATQLFAEVVERLEQPARRYVEAVARTD